MPDAFEKFTERARTVFTLAQEEAARFNHNYIGTEHLLLGLVREGDGIPARVLASFGVQLPNARAAVEMIIGRGTGLFTGLPGLTPRAKKVIELAMDEARQLNNHYIGPEHLLLGLVDEGEGIATGVLQSLGVNTYAVRERVLKIIADPASDPLPSIPMTSPAGTSATLKFLRFFGFSARDIWRLDVIARQQERSVDDLIREAVRRIWLSDEGDSEPPPHPAPLPLAGEGRL